jgi:hypothetical protein
MNNKLIELLERSIIQKEVQALARSHLARSVLFLDAGRSAAFFCEARTLNEQV